MHKMLCTSRRLQVQEFLFYRLRNVAIGFVVPILTFPLGNTVVALFGDCKSTHKLEEDAITKTLLQKGGGKVHLLFLQSTL